MASAKEKADLEKQNKKKEMDNSGVQAKRPPIIPRRPKPQIAEKPAVPPKPHFTIDHDDRSNKIEESSMGETRESKIKKPDVVPRKTRPRITDPTSLQNIQEQEFSSQEWKEKILINYKNLVGNTDLEQTLDQLYEEEVLSGEEKELVEKVTPNTTNSKNRQLLRILLRKSQTCYEKFLNSLEEIGHGDFVHRIKNTDTRESRMHISIKYETQDAVSLRRKIFKNYAKIVNDCALDDLLDGFISERVFEMSDVENITNTVPNTTEERNRQFLDILLEGEHLGYGLFLDALDEQGHKDLVSRIKDTRVDFTVDKEIQDHMRRKNKDSVPDHIKELHEIRLQKWEEETVFFCATKGTRNVLDAIRKHQVVTVTGNAGAGKSASIHYAALELKKEGFSILPVDRPEEIMQYLHPSKKQVFVFDDPIGVHGLDRDIFKIWLFYDSKLQTCISPGNTKIVCSIRRQVCNELDFKDEKCILNKHIVDLQDEENKLSDREKLDMIKKYLMCEESNMLITADAKTKLLGTQELFPLLCKLFSSSKEFQEVGWSFFKNPFSVVLEDLDKMQRLAKDKYCVLVLCFASENSLDIKLFDPFTDNKLRQEFQPYLHAFRIDNISALADTHESLVGVFLRRVGDRLEFNHDLMYDVVAFHFGNKYPKQVLKLGSSKFIRDRIAVSKHDVGSNDQNVIILTSNHFSDLIHRLICDLEKGIYNHVMMNKCWDNCAFMETFKEIFKQLTFREKTREKRNLINLFCQVNDNSGKPFEEELKELRNVGIVGKFTKYNIAMNALQYPHVTLLHWVVAFAHWPLFNFIWERLSVKQKQDVTKTPLLHFACLGGDINICKMLLDDGEIQRINSQVLEACPIGKPLHYAACSNADVVTLLIEHGANINAAANNGRTALFYACGFGNIDVASVLISKRANINQCDKQGVSPLFASAQNNYPKITALLLQNGAKVDLYNISGTSALMIACLENNVECAELILGDENCNIDHKTKSGFTASLYASKKGCEDSVKLLIHHGADVNEQTNEGVTALMMTCEKNKVHCSKLLLDEHCDVNMKNSDGWTAIMYACNTKSVECTKLLLDCGRCDVSIQSNNGLTALILACDTNSIVCTSLLLECEKCDINQCDNNGLTALMAACNEDNVDCANILLQNEKCDVNVKEHNGGTALIMACNEQSSNCVKLLLDHKHCDVDIQDIKGNTALMQACRKENARCVKLLLSRGCDINLVNNQGVDALLIAERGSCSEIIHLLRGHSH